MPTLRLFIPCLLFAFILSADNLHVSVLKVKQTHNGVPFECALTKQPPLDGCDAYYVRFPSQIQTSSTANNTVTGELFRPIAPVKRRQAPAVLVFHVIGPGTFQLERMLCRHLARNGVTAMFFHLPYYGQRGDKRGPYAMLETPEKFINSLEQAIRDSHRAIDFLLSFSDVNPAQIGTAGVSLGSLLTATSAGLDHRISKAFMILGAGNLPQIIANEAYETKAIRNFLAKLPPKRKDEILKRLKAYDPLTYSARLAELNKKGKFRMVNGDKDNVIPPDCSRQLAKATGTDILWLPESDHYTAFEHLKTVLDELTTFFASDVPPEWRPPKSEMPLEYQLFSIFANGLNAFIGGQPTSPGNCHILKGKAILRLLQGIELHVNLEYILGSDGKFRIAVAYGSSNIQAAAGQNQDTLWLHDGTRLLQIPIIQLNNQTLFDNPLFNIREVRLLRAATAFATYSPEMTCDVVDVKAQTSKDQRHSLTINSRASQLPGSFFISFDEKGNPKTVDVSYNTISISFEVHQWKLNSPEPKNIFLAPSAPQTASMDTQNAFPTISRKLFPFPFFQKK
ncbi:MAG: hypothetical protein J6X55_04925 [Victivallales bacterium]|nr:hypothetical protein [Victivallales bacterium]